MMPSRTSDNLFPFDPADLIESATDGIHIVNRDAYLVYANKAFLDMLGYDKSAIGKLRVDDFETTMNREIIDAKMHELSEGKRLTFETQLKRKDGSVVDVEMSLNMLFEESGPLVYGHARSLETRKLAEAERLKRLKAELELAAIQEKNRQIQALKDAASDGIHVVDAEGRLIDYSRSFLEMLGYSEEEAATLNVTDWDCSERSSNIGPIIEELIKHPAVFETLHRRKDGSTYYAEISARGVVMGDQTHLYASARDVTARKKAERELRELTKRQEHLFAIIGHELRTPASAIKMLLDEQGIRSIVPHGNAIADATDHLMNVLDDMRVVTRPELVLEAPDTIGTVPAMIEKTLTLLIRLLQEEHLTVTVTASEEAQREVIVKEQLLRQIVLNLVKNCAIHAHASELLIMIDAQSSEQGCRFNLIFRDNGRGISSDDQARLFEAFERGNTQADGMGLGLHISRKYAQEIFKGDLTYQPSPEGGAQFCLTACFRDASVLVTPAPAVQAENERCSLEGVRILFAEDTAVLRMATTQALVKKGAEVRAVADGMEALKEFRADQFDVVLSDLFMPNLDGYQLATELRARGYTKPIIGLTAAMVGDESERFLASGADTVLAKPLNIEALIDAIYQ